MIKGYRKRYSAKRQKAMPSNPVREVPPDEEVGVILTGRDLDYFNYLREHYPRDGWGVKKINYPNDLPKEIKSFIARISEFSEKRGFRFVL